LSLVTEFCFIRQDPNKVIYFRYFTVLMHLIDIIAQNIIYICIFNILFQFLPRGEINCCYSINSLSDKKRHNLDVTYVPLFDINSCFFICSKRIFSIDSP